MVEIDRVLMQQQCSRILEEDLSLDRGFMPIPALSSTSRFALNVTRDYATSMNHNYVGTEHMLVGLAGVRESVAGYVFKDLGVETSDIINAVRNIIIPQEKKPDIVRGEYTQRAKKVLEYAILEARIRNESVIGTHSLLAGIMREGEGIAYGVMEFNLGVSLKDVRRSNEVAVGHIKILGQSS